MSNFKKTKIALLLAAGAFGLTACGGDDGKNGEDGKPGEIALGINQVTNVVTKVEAANYDEASKTLTVEFSLTNPNGVAVTGLETLKDPIRLAFGRMGTRGEAFKPFELGEKQVAATADADNEIWLSYNNKLNATTGLHSGSANWRPNTNCAEGSQCLEYLGQGKYKITAANIINTNGLNYGYDATQTQGLYLIVYEAGSNKVKNTEMYYWNPADGKQTSSPRMQLEEQACTNCHVGQEHIRHSNYGNTAEQCGFCHTDYTQYQKTKKDADGNDVTVTYNGSIKGLVHGFHTGATETKRRTIGKFETTINKAGVNPAFSYIFDRPLTEDAKPRNFPTSMAGCESCHVSADTTVETLPEGLSSHALNWFADTDVSSCQSCHGDYHMSNRTADLPADPSDPNSPVVTTLTGCVACHNNDPDHGERTIAGATRHFANPAVTTNKAASQAGLNLETSYSLLAWDESTSSLTFNMSLSKKTANGSEPVTTEYLVGAPTVYVNAVDNQKPDAFLTSRAKGTAVANTDGSFTVTVDGTIASSLAEAINSGSADIAIMSSYKVCFKNKTDQLFATVDKACPTTDANGRALAVVSPNAAKTEFLKLDGTQGAARKSAADYANCQACHNNDMVVTSAPHFRNADLHACAQCHEAADNNSMIVRVHGTFGKAHGRDDVKALVNSANCSACHSDNISLADARSSAMRWGKGDNTFSSPQAGVCASCHVSDYYTIGQGKDAAKAHIENNGGIVAGSHADASSNIGKETCAVCHDAEYIKTKHQF